MNLWSEQNCRRCLPAAADSPAQPCSRRESSARQQMRASDNDQSDGGAQRFQFSQMLALSAESAERPNSLSPKTLTPPINLHLAVIIAILGLELCNAADRRSGGTGRRAGLRIL